MDERNTGSENNASWTSGPSTSHPQYLQSAEDEPSSSVSSSSTGVSYPTVSTASFSQPMYRQEGSYQESISNIRSQYADNYNISQAEARNLYQPAESSYVSQEQRDPSSESYQNNSTGNEVQQAQTFERLQGAEERYISAHTQPVASSSVSQSGGYPVHQLVIDSENRVVAVQRVISPVVDSTVSQSGQSLPYHRQVATSEALRVSHNSILLQSVRTSSTQPYMQLPVSTVPSSYSQSEVTTSDGSPSLGIQGHRPSDNDISQGHGEAEIVHGHRSGDSHPSDGMEAAVSSISGSVPDEIEAAVRIPIKTDRRRQLEEMEAMSGEPDTTQEDEDEYQQQSPERVYIDNSSSIDVGDNIHSSMVVATTRLRPSSSNMVDSVMDNEQLSSTQMTTTQLMPPHGLRLPLVSSSHLSTSHIATSVIAANQMPGHLTNGIPVQLASSSQYTNHLGSSEITTGHMDQSNLVTNQIAMPHITANQLASSSHLTSNLDPQLNQINCVLESTVVDTSSTLGEQNGHHMVPSYMVQQDTRLDSSTLADGPRPGTSSSLVSASGSYQDHVMKSNSRRKSNRIAEILENEIFTWKKPKFEIQSYNPSHLWCEECMTSYESECPLHKLLLVPDKIVFSRAWASLPQALQIFRLGEVDGAVELGVFAKRVIAKYTQFGPFVAECVDRQDQQTNSAFPLMVERSAMGDIAFFETSDENKCNWMMFVRPAQSYAEQNLVAYQHGPDIFFTVTKPIQVKGELKVWYASHYADRWGKQRLEITDEDVQAMEEQLCKFQCYECPKRFKTTSALQKHLSTHDESGAPRPGTSGEPSSTQTDSELKIKKRKSIAAQNLLMRKKLQAVKKIKDLTSPESQPGSAGTYHWKKRSTNIYLNKTLKKYHRRQESEAMRKCVQSMYRKTGRDAEGNEWVCNSCDLTFDNSNLLNLHTLTHAAEDVGLDEVRKFSYQGDNGSESGQVSYGQDVSGVVSLDHLSLACPVCQRQFSNKQDLIQHAAEHGRTKVTMDITNLHRPHKCDLCWKAFTTADRLVKHQLCHGDEESKPLQCHVCYKRFMNNSALSCHMKTHSANKYYECPICHQGFDQTAAMREHSLIHANADGMFNCPHCDKCFSEFLVLKKHVRGFHTNRYYPCPTCDKIFPRPDKLRLHMLRHSSVREFMCDTCGRQFKRKDKLKEHIKRMHSTEREERDRIKAMKPICKKFIPKVSPTEYHRFIYKCHLCLLGFKRRGMLVNHIAKKHPDIKPDSVPELNLPILKTQRDYYCQYCDKVYKSSSKRKAHILKNHPGAELPQSSRKKSILEEMPGVPNPTYSQTVGSITTMPHQCVYCHKQYASKAKLLQHQRKKHSGLVPAAPDRPKRGHELIQQIQQEVAQAGGEPTTIQVVERYDGEGNAHDSSQATDLLTQAMSELTQSLQEFRQNSAGNMPEGTYQLSARIGHGPPTMIQIQNTGGSSPGASTIDLAHLNQALQHFNPPQGHVPIQVQVSGLNQIQMPVSTSQSGGSVTPTHIVTVDPLQAPDSPQQQQQSSSQAQQQISFHPVNIVPGPYIPKSWTNYTYK